MAGGRVWGGGKRRYSDLSSDPEIMPGIRGPTGGWPSQQAPICSCAAGSKHLTHQRWGQPEMCVPLSHHALVSFSYCLTAQGFLHVTFRSTAAGMKPFLFASVLCGRQLPSQTHSVTSWATQGYDLQCSRPSQSPVLERRTPCASRQVTGGSVPGHSPSGHGDLQSATALYLLPFPLFLLSRFVWFPFSSQPLFLLREGW